MTEYRFVPASYNGIYEHGKKLSDGPWSKDHTGKLVCYGRLEVVGEVVEEGGADIFLPVELPEFWPPQEYDIWQDDAGIIYVYNGTMLMSSTGKDGIFPDQTAPLPKGLHLVLAKDILGGYTNKPTIRR